MTPLEQVQNLYTAYTIQAMEVAKNTPYTSGLFGMGRRASDDPCHERFIESLTALMKEFKESGVPSAELREALSFIFEAHGQYTDKPDIYWMLIAAHGAAVEVIPRLSREDASALRDQYEKLFKRPSRMPVQTKIVKLLGQAAK